MCRGVVNVALSAEPRFRTEIWHENYKVPNELMNGGPPRARPGPADAETILFSTASGDCRWDRAACTNLNYKAHFLHVIRFNTIYCRDKAGV